MVTIIRTSFTATAESEEKLLELLLKVTGFTVDSLAVHMNVNAEIIAQNPLMVKTYLSDIIDANLVHLGYVIKDTKHEAILGEYREQAALQEEKSIDDDKLQSFTINQDAIITTDGSLKISLLHNITQAIS